MSRRRELTDEQIQAAFRDAGAEVPTSDQISRERQFLDDHFSVITRRDTLRQTDKR